MKIGPVDIKPPPASPAAERKPSPLPPAGDEPSAFVELSSQAVLHQSEIQRADFDSAKVERIAKAIRDGSFHIDADAIADKLISNAQELLPKSSL